ncbi:SusD/RagB family nutrient-binding outer membrane lipoprotein [Bacteroides xylanisolvens]|uniref:SusD/RagB family nutrient-binding outer membrane lipoprotein n=1 Tax=Bacteroides xylanisolvens TaxID=371601 RepID=A0A4Q5D5I1_9BACE|nr:SusD/RagB family nutrient-binding outer membrane lipoprotein [Bacteroides xylanisolvens]KAB6081981.1 SusD/RagB family nutrient-binding outer membrane lipoprotein [Bacteroides xylanisolvens]KAB6082734.1 SusD/RagB family nutrient-binding outer membrane lipoprotein [Bacteroides xylanisolvens]KAB6092632.1 SusD/RagB family nutrient-binding outer membrane lipoprotein [Bacteroides xylanisolvens]KAB6114482.1 SusD/RagB family nutrient-binding outer membrane lipoprotein [Bacteroides xylanisolvens]RYT
MRQSKYITIITMACALFFASCSDEYMENMNTDPSKAATIDPNAQLTTAQLQTYGDLSMIEIYRNYHYAFTQQLMGCWNTTNYGGRHTLDNNEMSRIWTSFYTQSLKNIIDAQYRTAEDAEKVNINSVLRIYRVYLMSIITDTYGDAPFSEAGLGFLEGKFNPKYDKQEDIYNAFFLELEDAVNKIDPTKDKVTGDLIYAGDVTKWQQLANSLRLRFAMRISNVNPTKAQTEFENALAANGGVITDASSDALIKYMTIAFSFGQEAYSDYRGNSLSQLLFGNDPANNPSYLCSTFFNQLYNSGDPRTFKISRCYYDGLMSATSPDNRVDITQEMIEKGIAFSPRDPGAYSWEPWPTGYDSDICAELAVNNPSVTATMAREVEPKLANNFLKSDNPGVVMTSAEVKFLMAEATVKKWNVGSVSAEDLYKQGVRAAIDFLTDNYGCTATTDAEFDAFIQDKGAFGHTDNQKLEAINTQAWILHFTNPAECWANVRRSGYPKLKSPAEYGFGQYLTGGTEIPVRLCYPVLESSYNKKSYNEAIERMGGTDNWHSLLWWDTEN